MVPIHKEGSKAELIYNQLYTNFFAGSILKNLRKASTRKINRIYRLSRCNMDSVRINHVSMLFLMPRTNIKFFQRGSTSITSIIQKHLVRLIMKYYLTNSITMKSKAIAHQWFKSYILLIESSPCQLEWLNPLHVRPSYGKRHVSILGLFIFMSCVN